MTDIDVRAIRADTWLEAAEQIDGIMSEIEDHGNDIADTWEGHPMTALSIDHLLIVQAWLREAAEEVGVRNR
jgi:hypothetical protein